MDPLGPQTATPDRILKSIPPRRRRTIRHHVHTPAYASLNGNSDDMVLDLSEILDISERGAAIQTSSPWDLSRDVNLCLDLSETKTYLHTTGHVVWADKTGRIGVSFPELPEDSRRKLKEWLFLNAMVGAANYAMFAYDMLHTASRNATAPAALCAPSSRKVWPEAVVTNCERPGH